MKYLIIIVLLIPLSQNITAQADSSKAKLSVNIQARDCEYIASFSGHENIFEDLDSVMKKRFRPAASAPSGNTNVSVDSIQLKAWRELVRRLRNTADAAAVYNRVDAILRATNNVWLINKLNNDTGDIDAIYVDKRLYGRNRLKKELED